MPPAAGTRQLGLVVTGAGRPGCRWPASSSTPAARTDGHCHDGRGRHGFAHVPSFGTGTFVAQRTKELPPPLRKGKPARRVDCLRSHHRCGRRGLCKQPEGEFVPR